MRVPGRSSPINLAQIVLKQVGLDELGFPGQSFLAGQRFRLPHKVGVDLDACGANAKSLAGCDDDAAVARAEIDQNVRRLDVSEIQHGVHHVWRRGNKRDIRELPIGLGEKRSGYCESKRD